MFSKEIRHQRSTVRKLKGAASSQFEGAGIHKISVRIESGPGPGMQVEVHGARVEYFLTGLGIDSSAIALKHGGQTGCAIPFVAPKLESPVASDESRKDFSSVGIACADKRDVRPVFFPVVPAQFQKPVQGGVGRHRKVAHVLRAGPFERCDARLLLNHEPEIVARRQLLPIGQMPVVFDKPYRRQKFFPPEMLQRRKN